MTALQESTQLEDTARDITVNIPHHRQYSRAGAIDRFMRSNIRVDQYKLAIINSGRSPGSYRNSVETYNDTQGVCGEQAFLYIVLARYAGLDARFLLQEQGRTRHALSRVHLANATIDIDHLDPDGFDCVIDQRNTRELEDHEVEEMYRSLNLGLSCYTHPSLDYSTSQIDHQHEYHHYSEPSSQYGRHYNCQLQSHSGGSLFQSIAFSLAGFFIVPWAMQFSQDFALMRSKTNPLMIHPSAQEYVQAARKIVRSRAGLQGEQALESRMRYFDQDCDGLISPSEGYALYLYARDTLTTAK